MGKVEGKQPDKKKAGIDMSKIMGLFTLVVFCAFPVVYTNFYYNILETKYIFYAASAIVMIVLSVIYGLYTNQLVDFCRQLNVKQMIKGLNLVDWAVLAFWLANVFSWVVCAWHWEAFWGTSGRYNGVFLMTIYTAVYFLTTRFFKVKRIYLDAFLAVSLFVCLFGISDHFQMDLLGFKAGMLDKQKAIYTSTLGNINTYTVYVGAVMVVSMILFVMETCRYRNVFYFFTMAISMIALIVGASDNAYLTLAALFGLSPVYLFRRKSWIVKYLMSVAVFLSAVLFVGWIGVKYQDIVYPIEGIFSILTKLTMVPKVTAALWAVVLAGAFVIYRGNGTRKDELGPALSFVWIGVIAVVVAAVVYVLYDANIAGNAEKYQAFQSYVVFNDSWGTNRGYVWIRSMELFKNVLTPLEQLFGHGADTFGLLMMFNYPIEDGILFDSAHNEYLHFLVTTGVFGVVSYILMLGFGVWAMAKRAKGRPEIVAMIFVVLAYATQALVNINLPVVFPVIWQLFAIGLSKIEELN